MSTDALRELSTLCAQLRDAEESAESAEKEMKDRKALARKISEEDIPGLMQELGVKKLVLDTGETITIGLEVYASLSEERKAAAFAWLEANGFGGLIATEVSVPFSREQYAEAAAFVERLECDGWLPEVKQGVHASRLKAFLKERLTFEATALDLPPAAKLPLEIFGARPVTLAKIKKQRALPQ